LGQPGPVGKVLGGNPDDEVTGVVDVVLPTLEGAVSVEVLVDGQVVDRATRSGASPLPCASSPSPNGRRPAAADARRCTGGALGGTRRAARSALHRPGQ
jgi:hypothetical protein